VYNGVFEEDGLSELASPKFEITKKIGTMRVVTYFKKLNLLLKFHPYPFPKIWKGEGLTSALKHRLS
jgi:hypothetical protein